MQCTYRSLVLKVEVSGLKFVCLIKKPIEEKTTLNIGRKGTILEAAFR